MNYHKQFCDFTEKVMRKPEIQVFNQLLGNCASTGDYSSGIMIEFDYFNIEDEKIIIVGDKVGYTTTSSPFFCLNEGIETGRIKRGDTILFWTIGAGHEMVAMLFKY